MISSIFYNGDGSTRIFPVTFKINGEDYVRVYVDNVEVVDRTKYDIINNSIVFTSDDIPAVGTDNIKIYVATSASELGDLGAPLTDITNVANSLAEIVAVSTQVVPNLPEILLADNNATIATSQATIATTKASEASASATSASSSATTATTKASEANASAISASNSATSASNSAAIATTKANEASSSASSALTSANNASTSEDNALLYANNAKGYADSINPSLLVSSTEYSTHLSVPASYHIYNGQLALSNTVTTAGFSTTLYTGNGTTQSITTGVDMATQWGNDASEKFGGLVWLKSRSAATNNFLFDTIRGALNEINSNTTEAQASLANSLTAFNDTGYSVGSAAGINVSAATYASWHFQTTHRISGVTNHGKPFTCHYNPFTGFTIVKYEGSGLAGHEIPHFLGRKLGFSTIKNLTTSETYAWVSRSPILDAGKCLFLHSTLAQASGADAYDLGESNCVMTSALTINGSGATYILYGWADSYFDEKNTLIGNYEIGVYQGTGVAGNKVTTRGKPAWVMIKRLDSTGDWTIFDNLRTPFGTNRLFPSSLSAEVTTTSILTVLSDGFSLSTADTFSNASGGQYLYMVVYDNDSGSGKSKYPRATDTSTLNLNAHVPFANGIDTTGSKVSIAYKNETITLSNALVQGKNYIALLNDGSYVATAIKPSYGLINPSSGDFFNLDTQKWYNNSNVEITSRNYLDCIVYADQNGQPEYVEQLPKTEYVDTLSLDNLTYKGNEIGGFLGVGQTWQNVTGRRVSGVIYTNTSGRPICVAIYAGSIDTTPSVQLAVDSVTIAYIGIETANASNRVCVNGIVPNNSTYLFATGDANYSVFELR